MTPPSARCRIPASGGSMRSRRTFLKWGLAVGAAWSGLTHRLQALPQTQPGAAPATRSIRTPALDIGYEESGPPQGFPVIMLHGFPDDVRAWDDVAAPVARAGYRVLV